MFSNDGQGLARVCLREIAKLFLPPIVVKLARATLSRVRNPQKSSQRPSIEYVPQGWDYAINNPALRGWDEESIVGAQKQKWHRFRELVQGAGPVGIGHEGDLDSITEISHHNTIMVFAYAACLASRNLKSMSMLDWGGGLGQYYLLAESLLPDVSIDYTCKDLPKAVECGAVLLPQQHFVSDNSYLDRSYDFVLASSALQYSRHWEAVLANLARVTLGYLLVTRLPVVEDVPSFVFIHRPYDFGYYSEYLGWCLNRPEFLSGAEELGLRLIREFPIGEHIDITGAPQACVPRAFLFKSNRNSGTDQPGRADL